MMDKKDVDMKFNGRSDLGIHQLLNARYSPRAFSDRDVTDAELELVLEAARWASSSHNEQPWRFLVTRKDKDGHAAMLDSLWSMNRSWADKAPILILNMVQRNFAYNNEENYFARHDLGGALAQLTAQATSMGMGLHQLAGFHADQARQAFQIPEALDVVSVLALGFPGNADVLEEPYRGRELKRSQRRPLSELVFMGRYK
jgi:nitroreductase